MNNNILVLNKVKDDSSCVDVNNFISAECNNIHSNDTATNIDAIVPLTSSQNNVVLEEEYDDSTNKKQRQFVDSAVDAKNDDPSSNIDSTAAATNDATAAAIATTTMPLLSLQRSNSINENDVVDEKDNAMKSLIMMTMAEKIAITWASNRAKVTAIAAIRKLMKLMSAWCMKNKNNKKVIAKRKNIYCKILKKILQESANQR